jgi:transcriptional regulator GlxA family with amidase domain
MTITLPPQPEPAARPAPARPHVVALAVTDGAPVFELAAPCEVFGIDRRDLADPWYELRLVAAEPGPVRTAAGLWVATPHTVESLVEADTVLVAPPARERRLDPPPGLIAAVRAAHARGRRVVSLCAGVYVLAAAGLLDGRRATTHWKYADEFARQFPRVRVDPAPLYTDDGDVLTSAGTGAVIDLCLHLVRSDHGSAVANEVARRMVVPPHREGGQSQYVPPPTGRSAGSDGLGTALAWARERLHEPLTVGDLARAAHMSERTFTRRFREVTGLTPLRWVLHERVRLAQERLETSDDPVEAVARHSGFGTAANLRHHFRRATGIAPAHYRRAFRHRHRAAGATGGAGGASGAAGVSETTADVARTGD